MHREPLVYIIVVNWNCYQLTNDCLSSLINLDYKNFRVVLIDNESRNKEVNILSKKFNNFIFIKNKNNTGFSYANNQGMRLALKRKAKYILLLNNDTIVKPNFLKILVNYAEKNKFEGILTPKILYFKTHKIWAMGGKLPIITGIPRMIGQGKPARQYTNIIEPDYASGCAFFINSNLVKKVGYLDTHYFAYYEDTDYSFRIKKDGYKILVIPQSIIWHKVSQSTKQRNLNKIGSEQSYLLAKNGVRFGLNNLQGLAKSIYLFNQYTTKYILYLFFKCEDSKARRSYTRGLIDSVKLFAEI